MTSNIRQYLSRNDLYTLSWACYPVVCILFVAFHLKLATNSVGDGVEDAKRALAASCNAAQKAATVAASLPRYLAQGVLCCPLPLPLAPFPISLFGSNGQTTKDNLAIVTCGTCYRT